MLDLQAFLYGVLVPGFITGIGLALFWRPSIRAFPTPARGEGPRASVFALLSGIAFFTAYSLAMEIPPIPFGARQLAGLDWLVWFSLATAPLFLWEGGRKSLLLRIPLVGLMLAFTLRAMVIHHWEGLEAPLWLSGLLTGWILLQYVGNGLNERVQRASMPIVLLLIGTGMALTIGFNGSARLGQVTGMTCATFGAAMLLGLWHEGFRLRSGDVSYALLLLFGLGISSFFFSDLPPLDAGLLLASPIVAWLVSPLTKNLKTVQATLLIALAASIPLITAGVRGYLTFVETSSQDSYYDY